MMGKWSKMSTREAMIVLAGRPPAHGELGRWLQKIARSAGISFRTARSLWNEEITDPNHLAAKAVRQRAKLRKQNAMRQWWQTFLVGGLKRLPTSTRISIGTRLMRSSRRRAQLAVEIAPEIVEES